jgi:hypothetical protein
MVLHRLDISAQQSAVPEFATFAGELRTALAERWGPLSLALAPAFS